MNKFIYLILMAGLFLCTQSIAQERTSKEIQISKSESEIIILKSQLTSIKQHQDQLTSIVLWSLSAVIAMALGLAAFNWYTSKINYEREIQSIHSESQVKYQDIQSSLSNEIAAYSKSLKDDLTSREEEIKNSIINELNKKIATQTAIIDRQNSRLVGLEFDAKQKSAEEAISKGRLEWGIYQYCDLLDISVQQGSDFYQVGEILDEISKALVNPKTSLTSENVNRTVEVMRRLPKRYQAAVENLIPKVNMAHG